MTDSCDALALDRSGALWVGTAAGLDRWQPERSAFVHFRHDAQDPASLEGNQVSQVIEDQNGSLWVGTFDGGMFTDSWNGKNWRLKPVAAPKGGKEGFLSSVSCTSASACTAVGDYLHGSRLVPLSERWNGKKWATS